jgi:hypothetical protein
MSLERARRRRLGQRPGNASAYRQRFIATVHHVLGTAFLRLRAATLADKEETAITGLLVEQMRALVESRACPAGAQHFAIHDDQPQSGGGVEGKSRPRIDIVVERSGPGRRPRFHFEAKRLHRGDSVAEYIGDEGMKCFLSGKYAKDEPDAGMLGYVQHDTPGAWATRLETKLAAASVDWARHSLSASLPHTYRSSHARNGQPFALFHVLLVCT